jgi:regulator of replication initiation timing
MRAARLQTNDLGRADHFVGALLSKESVKEVERVPAAEITKAPQVNGGSLALRGDSSKTRFSDPPAPPPQQPLPEKPDVGRPHSFDPSSPVPSLKRTNTERPPAILSGSPTRQESSSQIMSLVEALASAKKELDSQSARMRNLEEMLQKERQARELAEELAKRLEQQSSEAKVNGNSVGSSEAPVSEEALQSPLESTETNPAAQEYQETEAESPDSKSLEKDEAVQESSPENEVVDTKPITDSTSLLEKRLETMLVEMQQLRENMESFKKRAEIAEAERDTDRKTLAEMVEKIRLEESARGSSSTERGRSPADGLAKDPSSSPRSFTDTLSQSLQKAAFINGNISSAKEVEPGRIASGTLSRPPGGHDPILYHTTPYASMLGVVLIGMGLMAYLNGWQSPKIDR